MGLADPCRVFPISVLFDLPQFSARNEVCLTICEKWRRSSGFRLLLARQPSATSRVFACELSTWRIPLFLVPAIRRVRFPSIRKGRIAQSAETSSFPIVGLTGCGVWNEVTYSIADIKCELGFHRTPIHTLYLLEFSSFFLSFLHSTWI